MPIDTSTARELLKAHELKRLFVEQLNWSNTRRPPITVQIEGTDYTLIPVAEQGGMVVLGCSPRPDGSVPDSRLRRAIDKQVTPQVHEHLIVYVDALRHKSVWTWPKREGNRFVGLREATYHVTSSGEPLLQRLARLDFEFEDLNEDGTVSVTKVRERAARAFDVEKVTKRFYEEFRTHHEAFLKFLSGIEKLEHRHWYTSVMLNRLMFIYFVQRRRFLDSDPSYLCNRLEISKSRGKNQFYRSFLIPLFFRGFASREDERDAATNNLLGKIPYLNGGLFQPHQLEVDRGVTPEGGGEIDIPDEAFERIFEFFDKYTWHLDERPLRADNEINPDVLGYIFEKYINAIQPGAQKAMGAYYTKEDITGYISRNTIIPFLFDAARKECRSAFEGDKSVWRILVENPDRYIYEAVRHGVDLPLPEEVAGGLDDILKRTEWNNPAPPEFALPTEIWREVIVRRKRYEEVRAKLRSGGVRKINDLITYNLDICRFAQDSIERSDSPELLRAFWHAIRDVTVLDPTVGSGAFLFAALNTLEPLYSACLARMQVLVEELDCGDRSHRPERLSDFREVLDQAAEHPNRRYFVLKSIAVNNLFGVDIMEEAVEICKLRLFLKLAAQVERVENIEPLPDIDFNVRTGNTLVGYATYDEVARTLASKLDFGQAAERIEEKAQDLDRLSAHFRKQQTALGGEVIPSDKQQLRDRLSALGDELNLYLAAEYDLDTSGDAYTQWLATHKPFHWFVEFHSLVQRGGFDVVIGNPPYAEYSKVKNQYRLLPSFGDYSTNLYSACCYRAHTVKRDPGYASFIVPVSLPSTDRMQPLRESLAARHTIHHVSFSTRPSKLFEGAEQRLTIYVQSPGGKASVYSGGYLKWSSEERPHLFECIHYVEADPLPTRSNLWPKVRGTTESEVLRKVLSHGSLEQQQMLGTGACLYYKNTGIRYFNTVTLRPPRCWINGVATSSSRETVLPVRPGYLHAVHALLLSSLFFLYYEATSNCRDLNPSDIRQAPAPDLLSSLPTLERLSSAAEEDYISKGKVLRMHNKLTGLVEIESLTPAGSKAIIDEIDRVLAQHYGITDEEMDFIINYDIKYRMGIAEGAEDE